MRNFALAILLGVAIWAGSAAAADPAEPAVEAKSKCQAAEINPVTGHVFCIRPLGAPVEPPPADIAPPCDPEQSRGQWTWAPNCVPSSEGM
ncbi:MAG: hypothetical protein ACREDO_13095 [Methyloceanibacter sp.]